MTAISQTAKRCLKEYKEVLESDEMRSGQIKLDIISSGWQVLSGEILGPPDTPYEGGHFKLLIEIPDTYPSYPPKVRFLSYIWHPNVSSVTGYICLDILKDRWEPILSLRTILLSVQVLLSSPEPDDPQDMVVATQLRDYPEMFDMTARHWTNIYADGPFNNPEFNEKVALVLDMGVEVHEARVALSMCRWDLQTAVENLFPDSDPPFSLLQ